MKTKFWEEQWVYDGSQLHSLFAYMKWQLSGDSIVSWIGPCQVATEHMVDGEDLAAGATIAGDRMVHFIVEKYNASLLAAVALQRLLTAIAIETLTAISDRAENLVRDGDDIFDRSQRKLSISIATVSPTSALIHFAVNVTNDGTPVSTLSLGDLKVDAQAFAVEVMKRFAREVESVELATQKVKWVR